MNTKYRRVEAEFEPETRFEVDPLPPAPFRACQETRLERLKGRLLQERLDTPWEPHLNSSVRRAANEAAALAWLTPYPLLVFPELFAEKVRAAEAYAERQNRVRRDSRELLAV